MSRIPKFTIAGFSKGFLDLTWYILSISTLLSIFILIFGWISGFKATLWTFYLQSGLAINIRLDDPVCKLALDKLGFSGPQTLDLSMSLLSIEENGAIILCGFLAGTIQLGIGLLIVYNLRQFLQTVIDKTPFLIENGKRLRTIGLGLVIGFFALLLTAILHSYFVADVIEWESMMVYSDERGVVSIWVLLLGLVFIVIADAFKYGSDLQLDQDLTV